VLHGFNPTLMNALKNANRVPPYTEETMLELLRLNGGRITPTRRALVKVLLSQKGHHTAEQLEALIVVELPHVYLSTIYRNLEDLEKLGVVTHTHLSHGPAVYHLASDVHGHLFCESCGKTIDVFADMFSSLRSNVQNEFSFEINPNHFAIPGTCFDCQA
jgi:Fur family ferric uptake transcriptional regulator